MPIFEYQCEKCDHVFEQLVFSEGDKNISCPECGRKKIKKLLSSTGFIGKSDKGSCSAGAPKGFS